MTDRATIDTNVLIYAFGKQNDSRKRIAIDTIEFCDVISLQALNELISVLRKKFNFSFDEINKIVDFIEAHFVVSELSLKTLRLTVEISKKYQYSYWDSMIVAAALENHCTRLFTEDLHHDQLIEGKLKIINPFLPG